MRGCSFIALHRDNRLCEWHYREFVEFHDDVFFTIGCGLLAVYPHLTDVVAWYWMSGVRSAKWMRTYIRRLVKGEFLS